MISFLYNMTVYKDMTFINGPLPPVIQKWSWNEICVVVLLD